MPAAIPFDDRYVRIPIVGCWLWSGRVTPTGYGMYTHPGQKVRHGNPSYAHRVSMERYLGRLLVRGECVLHRCDTPACVNPHHLEIGTKKDNTQDMVAKNRDRLFGERNPVCKLTDEQVAEIRARKESGCKLGPLYGVSRSTITAIRRFETRVFGTNEPKPHDRKRRRK